MHGYSPVFRGARVLFFLSVLAPASAPGGCYRRPRFRRRAPPPPPRAARQSPARATRGLAMPAVASVASSRPETERLLRTTPGAAKEKPRDARRDEAKARWALVPYLAALIFSGPPDRSDAPGFSPASSRRWLHRRVAGGTRAKRERPDASRTSNASRRSSTNRVVTRRPRPSPVLLGIKRMTRLRDRRSSDARLDIPAPPVRSPRSFVSDLPRAPSHIHRSSPARSRSPPTSVTRRRRRRRRRWWRATSPASTSSPPPTRSRANSSAPR
jgi:hypothetical protein